VGKAQVCGAAHTLTPHLGAYTQQAAIWNIFNRCTGALLLSLLTQTLFLLGPPLIGLSDGLCDTTRMTSHTLTFCACPPS
jgi:cell division protein FtsB